VTTPSADPGTMQALDTFVMSCPHNATVLSPWMEAGGSQIAAHRPVPGSILRMVASEPRTPEPDGAAVVAALRARDESAFEDLVRTHSSSLLRVARRFMMSEEDARDALQDAFVAVVRSIGAFEQKARLSTWLHRIVINACLMKLRTRRRRPEEAIEPLLPQFVDDGHQVAPSVPWQESAESILHRTELRELVRSSIDQLPDTYRVVLLLRDIEELSTEETARALGITTSAVKVRLHRARQALRTLLDPRMRGVTP
jgi:RNA polymerase sigma-70 factor (ECF subfamily)